MDKTPFVTTRPCKKSFDARLNVEYRSAGTSSDDATSLRRPAGGESDGGEAKGGFRREENVREQIRKEWEEEIQKDAK